MQNPHSFNTVRDNAHRHDGWNDGNGTKNSGVSKSVFSGSICEAEEAGQ